MNETPTHSHPIPTTTPSKRGLAVLAYDDIIRRPSVGRGAALIVVGLTAMIMWLSVQFAPDAFQDRCAGLGSSRTIPVKWGVVTIVAVTAIALAAGWGPIIRRVAHARQRRSVFLTSGGLTGWQFFRLTRLRWLKSVSNIVRRVAAAPSIALSALDFVLVRGVAVLAGATLRPLSLRYGALFAWLATATAAAWLAPAPWGLVGVGLGVVIVAALVRRWGWAEEDRLAFLISGAEEKKEAAYRVGFRQDLRDEVLTSFSALFLLIPLGLRQADLAFDLFHHDPTGTSLNVGAWIGFFGAELAKSVPFVDWSEVYGVSNASPICPRTAAGAHAVFALRASVDLFLLAAVVQAIQVSTRISAQRRAFFQDGTVDRLDPFVEREVFSARTTDDDRTGWYETDYDEALEAAHGFPAYDGSRLRWLIAKSDEPPLVREFAIALLSKLDPEGAGTALISILSDRNSYVRRTAINALGELREKRAVEPLLEFLRVDEEAATSGGSTSDEDAFYLGAQAARALGFIGDARAVEPLIHVLKHPWNFDEPAVADAVEALGRIGDRRALDVLIEVSEDREQVMEVHLSAIHAVGSLGVTDAFEWLAALLQDDDPDVRFAAAEALGSLGDARAEGYLRNLLSDESGSDYGGSTVCEAATEALEQLSRKGATS